MNPLGFIGLLREIYGNKKPDLDRIQKKGLLAVKIAQHYALRIDFLDENVCTHLAKLFRQTNSLPAEDIDKLLHQYVDNIWFDRIKNLQNRPFASASVGQVHRAELEDGTQVIVKIIKQDFTHSFLRDIRSLRNLIRVALFFYPKLRKVFDPMGVLDHIEEYTLSELNLHHEIQGKDILQRIAEKYKDRYDLSRLCFPHFYPELSNKNVLVASFIEGKTFDELLDNGDLPYETLLELFSIHGLYLFGEGTFHGDIHPGNLILDLDGNIHFIDTGALSHTGDKIRLGLFRFFVSLSVYDYDRCTERLNEMALKKIEGKKFERFKSKFLDLYKDFENSTVSEVSLTKKMMDTIKLGIHCGMEFEKGMFSIIKSLMYLDGMVLRCKPDAVLLRDMRPFIEKFSKIVGA